MRHRNLRLHFTPHTIIIFLSSLALLGISIAVLVLEAQVQNAFRNEQIQYPGSSIAEWLFVSLNPEDIDAGPTVVKFVIGASSLAVSLVGAAWAILHWFRSSAVYVCIYYLIQTSGVQKLICDKIRTIGQTSCIAAVANAAAAIGFTAYIFYGEASKKLPEYFTKWRHAGLTQEFYVCEALPSLFDDVDTIIGFPACEYSVSDLPRS